MLAPICAANGAEPFKAAVAARRYREAQMSKQRWIKSIVETARTEKAELPFQRNLRKAKALRSSAA